MSAAPAPTDDLVSDASASSPSRSGAPVSDDFCLFALRESHAFGQSIADALGVSLCTHEESEFEDGEHKMRPTVNVRGKDTFVVQSLYGDAAYSVNDKLCRLLFFLGALRDAAAARVTAVVPYLCYQRKDRKTEPRDPVTTRYLAGLLESVGVDRVLTMDVHNLAAFQNAFRVRTDHLEARPLFVDRVADVTGDHDLVVLSPDEGGMKRMNRFAEGLRAVLAREVPTAFVEKMRSRGRVSGGTLVGDVEDRVVVIIDDLIGTGTTIAQATEACAAHGAHAVHVAATHGVFVGDADQKLAHPALTSVLVTNTIPPFRLEGTPVEATVSVCDAAPRFAEALRAIHAGGSVTRLNEMHREAG
jgi:ribose-phosphate pyrophosphokinase